MKTSQDKMQRAMQFSPLLLLIALLIHTWTGPDIWYHLALGRQVLESGQAEPPHRLIFFQKECVNVYWLFQITVYWLYQWGGVILGSLFFLSAWLITARFWLKTTTLKNADLAGWGFCVLAVFVAQKRFEPRPEILAYVCLSYQIFWWTRAQSTLPNIKQIFTLILSQALITNSHGYFIMGAPIALLGSVSLFLNKRAFLPANVFAVFGVALASFATPLGLEPLKMAFVHSGVLFELRYAIKEFHPPQFQYYTDWLFLVFWIWILGLTLFHLRRFKQKEFSLWAVGLVACGLLLSMQAIRNFPLLVLMSAPVVALEFSALSDFIKKRAVFLSQLKPSASYAAVIFCTATVLFYIFSNGYYESIRSPNRFGWGVSKDVYPVRLSEYLKENPVPGAILNDPNFGGYLSYHLPRQEIYADSRYCHAPSVVEYFQSLTNPELFMKKLHATPNLKAALLDVAPSLSVVTALMSSSDWVLVYADLLHVLFVKKDISQNRTQKISIYQNEDFYRTPNLHYMHQWITLLTQTEKRENLKKLVAELSQAHSIPGSLVIRLLEYTFIKKDVELLKQIVPLKNKIPANESRESHQIDTMLSSVPQELLK